MIKSFIWVLLLASSLQTSWAFSISGTSGNGGDAWQIPTLRYGSVKGPKHLGEEYRRNTPVMYYAFDTSFLGYFGPEGASGADGAFAILNTLTNVDNYTKTLSEFPLEGRHQNYQAEALGLLDIKTYTLGQMVEQMGLANPVQYAWTLHDRSGTPCPVGMSYIVVQRNYDIISSSLNQLQYSAYVNNTLYSYRILELCTGTPVAYAEPYSVDPLADTYSPVASFQEDWPNATLIFLWWGDYYTGLTRDDVAGLRYMLSTNNINWETPSADSLLLVTNYAAQFLFPVTIDTNGGFQGTGYGTASLSALLNFSKTNNLAALQAAFPGLQATVISNYFKLETVTNTVAYFTNYYSEPVGTPPHLKVVQVLTPTIVEYFVYRFDNIITNIYASKTISKIQTFTVAPVNGAPIGSPFQTNLTSTKYLTNNVPSGEFYILPTNSPCGLDIFATLVTFTNYTTNVLVSSVSTNTPTTTATNGTAGSITNSSYAYYQIQVTPSISHVYQIHPVVCGETNSVAGLYRGIGNIKFVRADYDSLLGQYWRPITNDYTMTMVTNSKSVTQYFRRIVTIPDFLLTAADMLPFAVMMRNLNFDDANVIPGLAGPGTIVPSTTFTYNKSGPAYLNTGFDVMDGSPYFTQTPGGDITGFYYSYYYVWANFDGTTNAPVVFPNGTSLENLQNQVLIQVSPANKTLPAGFTGVNYVLNDVKFTATGGAFTQPFTWTAAGLPPGLSVLPDGTLTGTPTQTGTYDFTLTLTDTVSRSVQWTYTITIF